MAKTIFYLVDSLGLSGKTLGLVNLAERLDDTRYRAVVASFAPPEGMLVERLRAGGVPVLHVPCDDGLNAGVVRRLVGIQRRYQPAVVHCFNTRPMLYGGIAAAMTARPAIGTLSAFACMTTGQHHTFLPQRLQTQTRRNRIRNHVLGRLLKWLTAVSKRAGERFCQDNAIPQRKLRVINYGVDVGGVSDVAADDVARLRAELGARPGEVLVGSVGRLVEQKDYPTQLRAFALAARHAPVRMVIAGGGPLDGELRALARALGVADRVCWLGERRDVPQILRCLDVFLIASKFEPFGVAVLEAMAAGLPIVATEVNELFDILDGGRAGMLVRPEHPEALAGALIKMGSDADLRMRFGSRARVLANERYSLPAIVTEYQELYSNVMNEART